MTGFEQQMSSFDAPTYYEYCEVCAELGRRKSKRKQAEEDERKALLTSYYIERDDQP